MQKQGQAIVNLSGQIVGHIDFIALRKGRIEVEGWADVSQVALVRGTERSSKAPDIQRPDVRHAYGDSIVPTPGFRLDLPFDLHSCFLVCATGAQELSLKIDSFDTSALALMRRRLFLPFMMACMRSIPAYLRWRLRRNPEDRAEIKDQLGLGIETPKAYMTPYLFAADVSEGDKTQTDISAEPVTIILPVFNAFDLLPEVLTRVLCHTDLPFELIVVEDCSTDAAVRPFLREWHKACNPDIQDQIHLIENEENLGFIGSVNRAFDMALGFGHHVILLNSDAFVPKAWASRLVRPLLEHLRVASVTPMSNDAEIFNAPVMCRGIALKEGVCDRIDAVAARLVPDAALADAPTGVGFCIAMHKDALRAVPSFDRAFDPGYGEEVDWCQKVAKKGWRHLGHGGVFVEHRSGTSFGSGKKAKLVAAHNKIVSDRYPHYDHSVQDFIANDPMVAPRLALALAWAAEQQTGKIPVYLGHTLGGGAEFYLKRRVAEDLDKGGVAVVIRAAAKGEWPVELHTKHGVTRGVTTSPQFLRRLVGLLPRRRLIYSCGVGAENLFELPGLLVDLAAGSGSELEILFHDYLPLSPSYTLLDSDGRYAPIRTPHDTWDKAHVYHCPDGRIVSLVEWRRAWAMAMLRADSVTVFSDSSRKIVSEAFPDASPKIKVAPHAVALKQRRLTPGNSAEGKPVIGVLGAIGFQKGAKVLQQISLALEQSGDAQLVVIGYMDPAYPLADSARIHGPYDVRDVPALAQRYGVSCWLIPSIWPETFSYTTHEALATGLPVWGFDLGAQADAIKRASVKSGQGGCLPLDHSTKNPERVLSTILSAHQSYTCPQSQSA
ncbi:glycosyltransferase [Roseovarius phycicola]|uniref:Glycosyltransferase n=1 Tax=Roseovarius phycicola TaxID=3080976 RepID=A0ABZ2HI70_9RHOB